MCSRTQYTDQTYMGGTGSCAPMTIIFGSVIQSQYTSLNIKFGVNRTFHVLKTPVTDLPYMVGTRPCGRMTIIFGSVIQSQHLSLNIKFGVNRTFHILKTPVYRFDLYGRNQTLWTDDDNFWQCHLELVYKSKYQIQYESDIPCAEGPSIPVWFIWEVPNPLHRYSPFSIPTGLWLSLKSIALRVRTKP